MAGPGSEARFSGLSLMQLNELLEDEGQLAAMVQKMEEVSRASRGRAGPGPPAGCRRRGSGGGDRDGKWEGSRRGVQGRGPENEAGISELRLDIRDGERWGWVSWGEEGVRGIETGLERGLQSRVGVTDRTEGPEG